MTAIDMNTPGFDFDSGHGYIDALAAVNATATSTLAPTPAPTPTPTPAPTRATPAPTRAPTRAPMPVATPQPTTEMSMSFDYGIRELMQFAEDETVVSRTYVRTGSYK